ncbi:MAG: hypothetical protein Q9173_005933 [Seirophora scorigena]
MLAVTENMDVPSSDAAEYQGCYQWTPGHVRDRRPTKRQKVTKKDGCFEALDPSLMVPLLDGIEAQHSVLLRGDLYNAAWQPQQEIIDGLCNNATIDTVHNVVDFIKGSSSVGIQESAIPSGLVTTGPSGSVFASTVASVTTQLKLDRKISTVNIIPSQVSNLKAALKLINNRATDSDPDAEDDLQNHEQYAYMTHYFANPLTVFLHEDLPSSKGFQVELCRCIRNLDSFKRLAEEMLDRNDAETVKRLLDDDEFLQDTVFKEIRKGKEILDSVLTAIDLLLSMHSCLDFKSTESWSNVYIKAMAGKLRDSAVVEETLIAVRKLPSDSLASLLNRLSNSPVHDMLTYADDLRKLETQKDDARPLRSEHNTHHQSLRTTIVAQKVELSTHVSSLSEQDRAYSRLVHRVDYSLKEYFQKALVTPQELFMHEVLIYDFKSPHREVFAPKPRHAIERALSSPRDYLGCNCCKGAQHGLSSTHPATSVLYQLYLESGALINISDLWSAFHTIVGTEDAEDEDEEQERVLAQPSVRRIGNPVDLVPNLCMPIHIMIMWMGIIAPASRWVNEAVLDQFLTADVATHEPHDNVAHFDVATLTYAQFVYDSLLCSLLRGLIVGKPRFQITAKWVFGKPKAEDVTIYSDRSPALIEKSAEYVQCIDLSSCSIIDRPLHESDLEPVRER